MYYIISLYRESSLGTHHVCMYATECSSPDSFTSNSTTLARRGVVERESSLDSRYRIAERFLSSPPVVGDTQAIRIYLHFIHSRDALT
jgi:hypothetical protein